MNTWKEYNKKVENRRTFPMLIKALGFAKIGPALDMGAGALVDSKYLLEQGYTVTAMDASDSSKEYAEQINHPNFKFIQSKFEDFQFENYNLITAHLALPFCAPDKINELIVHIKNSLNLEGVFVGQLFGINDGWSNNTAMNFHKKEDVQQSFLGMKILWFREEEYDQETAAGNMKHWHVFTVIAKKI